MVFLDNQPLNPRHPRIHRDRYSGAIARALLVALAPRRPLDSPAAVPPLGGPAALLRSCFAKSSALPPAPLRTPAVELPLPLALGVFAAVVAVPPQHQMAVATSNHQFLLLGLAVAPVAPTSYGRLLA